MHSPHIRTTRERIAVDGEKITEEEYAGLAAQDSSVMQQALAGKFGKLSHFEVLTALAFRHFQLSKVQQQHKASVTPDIARSFQPILMLHFSTMLKGTAHVL